MLRVEDIVPHHERTVCGVGHTYTFAPGIVLTALAPSFPSSDKLASAQRELPEAVARKGRTFPCREKPTLDAGGEDRETDARVLEALLEPDAQRPWSVEELAREIGDADAVADSLGRLGRAGLVHRRDGFVWAARSALAADSLGE